jgi:hypothetical protein
MKIATAGVRTLIAGVLIATGPVVAAAPASAGPNDDAFVNALDNAGIPYESPKDAVTMAKRVCSLLGPGGQGLQEAASYLNSEAGYSQDQMMAFGSAAVSVYCPKKAP